MEELLKGILPETEFVIGRPDSLKVSLIKEAKEWRYDRDMFRRASGVFSGPFLMPVLWQLCFENLAIPSLGDGVEVLGKASKPFVYQARAGLIRELHLGMYLSYFGRTTKNYYEDVYQGIDLRFDGKPIAIRHSGGKSDEVWRCRKAEKSTGCIVLTASGMGKGIHLVDLEEAKRLLF